MPNILTEIAIFLEPVGVGVVLVFIYSIVARRGVSKRVEDASLGFVFGLAAVLAMANPIEMSEGIIVDMRNLFVGLAAAFFGVRGGAIALAMAIAVRLGIGGVGAITGVVGVTIAALMGLAWARFVRPRITSDIFALPALAAMISLHIVAGYMLPAASQTMFFTMLAPLLILLNLICTTLFAFLIYRERMLLGETSRLQTAAMFDPLTRIMNRGSAIEAYERIIRGPTAQRGIAMSCIDVDNFKAINDIHGHLAGDKVLHDIAERLTTCFRAQDLFCRMSGDEFLFVLSNVSSEEARQITERCRSLISRVPVTYEGITINVTISLGTVWSATYAPFETLRNDADKALYGAKNGGRDQVNFSAQTANPSAA